MSERWKVTYTLKLPVTISSSHQGYSGLRVRFCFDTDNKLVELEHELDTEDSESGDRVLEESGRRLHLLFEAMNFRHGARLIVGSRNAEKTSIIPGGSATTQYLDIQQKLDAQLFKAIRAPSESSISDETNRLNVWLVLANTARDTADDVNALRNYFLVLEDRHSGSQQKPSNYSQIKYARHFVSHGGSLGDPNLLSFLQTEFGVLVNQYDPSNKDHQQFVRKWRAEARTLVESEIESLL